MPLFPPRNKCKVNSLLDRNKGISLLEIIVVVVILGILGGVTFFYYTPAKEHAIGKEARTNLRLILAAEKIYRLETGNYYPPTGNESNATAINANLRLDVKTDKWGYAIYNNGTSFTAYADRNGTGSYLDCQYTIMQNATDGEPSAGASCP
ncbi:MAG: prepilin-type N-terminal cleavage/methylation domain-containing protein [Candidatus Omnitrophota bacterium]